MKIMVIKSKNLIIAEDFDGSAYSRSVGDIMIKETFPQYKDFDSMMVK